MFYAFSLKKIRKAAYGVFSVLLLAAAAVIVFLTLFPIKYADIVEEYSRKYDIAPELVMAVINAESGFNEKAVSPKGARGLMQIMKPTADWAAEKIGIENYSYDRINEPEINIEIGCWYLSRLMKEYNGDLTCVLAAYNAGGANVKKWINDERYSKTGSSLDSIPFEETGNYVKKVTANKRVYEFVFKIRGGIKKL